METIPGQDTNNTGPISVQEFLVDHPVINNIIDTARRIGPLPAHEFIDQVERLIMSMHRKKGAKTLHKNWRIPAQIASFVDDVIPDLFPHLANFSERVNVATLVGCFVIADKLGDYIRTGDKVPDNSWSAFRNQMRSEVQDFLYSIQDYTQQVKETLQIMDIVKKEVPELEKVDVRLEALLSRIDPSVKEAVEDQLMSDRRYAAFVIRLNQKKKKNLRLVRRDDDKIVGVVENTQES